MGERPRPSPQEGWVGQVKASGEAGRERGGRRGRNIMGDLAYRERKGGSAKAMEGLAFTLRSQT